MNNCTLNQSNPFRPVKGPYAPAKVQRKSDSTFPKGSIMERLVDFAYSVPDFRRTGKGNHRHELGDMIILLILARMSRCTGRVDIIEFGRHNLNKFQSMGMLRNGVPSEPTLYRVENGIDELGLDFNLSQDSIKRKTSKAARNLDTIQRIVFSLFSIWRGRREKLSDKAKGLAELMRGVSLSFSKLMKFLGQK